MLMVFGLVQVPNAEDWPQRRKALQTHTPHWNRETYAISKSREFLWLSWEVQCLPAQQQSL